MKLYSRGQVLFFSLGSGVIVFLLMVGFGLLGDREPAVDTPASVIPIDSPGFVLETNPVLDDETGMPVNAQEYSEEELENIRIYEKLNDTVVNISTEVRTLDWFMRPYLTEGGTGSGSIIDARGYILTNRHVVENAYNVYITLADGSAFNGEVVGTDAESDLAILKFDPGDKELTTIPLGTSEGLRPGQKVLAIGNPFGLERTLTTGVVSGLGRPIKTEDGLIIQNMIQTDASINPGNSGGPLINSRGQMIGINTSIYSTAGGSIGIGFAVPVDMARRVVPELMEYGKVIRGWIDIRVIPLDARIAEYAQLAVDSGILIQQIGSGGNAEQAGLRGGNLDEPVYYGRDILYLGGDILVEIDGHPIATVADFYASLEESKPGQEVDVVYIRKGRKQRTKLILSERK